MENSQHSFKEAFKDVEDGLDVKLVIALTVAIVLSVAIVFTVAIVFKDANVFKVANVWKPDETGMFKVATVKQVDGFVN
ncbi:hypothetical protein RJ55_02458 [Drechmeria coniospora]|nr:hypothetical protein RJ55_02458 [Drechmeria coniospora]